MRKAHPGMEVQTGMRFPLLKNMRLRISCSAYAYACCQVSTSSLAAA